jgi:hypothetical protein
MMAAVGIRIGRGESRKHRETGKEEADDEGEKRTPTTTTAASAVNGTG